MTPSEGEGYSASERLAYAPCAEGWGYERFE